MAVQCPLCSSKNVKVADRGKKRVWRFLMNNNRYLCPTCNITWRKKNSRGWQEARNVPPSETPFKG